MPVEFIGFTFQVVLINIDVILISVGKVQLEDLIPRMPLEKIPKPEPKPKVKEQEIVFEIKPGPERKVDLPRSPVVVEEQVTTIKKKPTVEQVIEFPRKPKTTEVLEETTTITKETTKEKPKPPSKPLKPGAQRPTVVEELVDVEVYERDEVTLKCKITGKPRPKITWFRSGKPIDEPRFRKTYTEEGVCTLFITVILPTDHTEFECRATNEYGMVSTFCQVKIVPKPCPGSPPPLSGSTTIEITKGDDRGPIDVPFKIPKRDVETTTKVKETIEGLKLKEERKRTEVDLVTEPRGPDEIEFVIHPDKPPPVVMSEDEVDRRRKVTGVTEVQRRPGFTRERTEVERRRGLPVTTSDTEIEMRKRITRVTETVQKIPGVTTERTEVDVRKRPPITREEVTVVEKKRPQTIEEEIITTKKTTITETTVTSDVEEVPRPTPVITEMTEIVPEHPEVKEKTEVLLEKEAPALEPVEFVIKETQKPPVPKKPTTTEKTEVEVHKGPPVTTSDTEIETRKRTTRVTETVQKIPGVTTERTEVDVRKRPPTTREEVTVLEKRPQTVEEIITTKKTTTVTETVVTSDVEEVPRPTPIITEMTEIVPQVPEVTEKTEVLLEKEAPPLEPVEFVIKEKQKPPVPKKPITTEEIITTKKTTTVTETVVTSDVEEVPRPTPIITEMTEIVPQVPEVTEKTEVLLEKEAPSLEPVEFVIKEKQKPPVPKKPITTEEIITTKKTTTVTETVVTSDVEEVPRPTPIITEMKEIVPEQPEVHEKTEILLEKEAPPLEPVEFVIKETHKEPELVREQPIEIDFHPPVPTKKEPEPEKVLKKEAPPPLEVQFFHPPKPQEVSVPLEQILPDNRVPPLEVQIEKPESPKKLEAPPEVVKEKKPPPPVPPMKPVKRKVVEHLPVEEIIQVPKMEVPKFEKPKVVERTLSPELVQEPPPMELEFVPPEVQEFVPAPEEVRPEEKFKPVFQEVEKPLPQELPAEQLQLPDFEKVEEVKPTPTKPKVADRKKIAPVESKPTRKPPEIVRHLQDVDVVVGEEIELVCEVEGYPPPVVQWFRDDKPVEGERYTKTYVENVAVLHIQPVTEVDETGFECRVTSELGTVSSFAEIYLIKPKSPETIEKTEVKIQKLPERLPEVEYIIQRPEEPKEVTESVTEVVTTVTETVTVEETTEEYQAPRVVKPLRDVDAPLGVEIKLTCEITGHPKPTIEWYRDDVLIEETERYTTITEETDVYTLIIHEVTEIENTTFECRATNEIGTVSTYAEVYVTEGPKVEEVAEEVTEVTTRVTETVTVERMEDVEEKEVEEYKAPEVIKHLSDVEVVEDETVTLICQIVGHPRPTIEWFRDDVLIDVDKEERYTTTYETTGVSILTISPATEEDNTGFECRATNEIGTASTFCEVYLQRRSPSPERIERTEVQIQKEAEPLPEVEFIVQQPEPEEHVKEETVQTTETTVTETVTVQREEVIEEVEYRAPEVTRHLEDVTVEIGERVELICEIQAHPQPTIEWYRDDILIDVEEIDRYTTTYEETGVSILTISEVTEEDDKTFECRAINELGTVSTFADIYLDRPKSPERIEKTEVLMETKPELPEFEFIIDKEEERDVVVEEIQERTEVHIQREEAPQPITLLVDVPTVSEEEQEVTTVTKVTETVTVERTPGQEVHEISEVELETEEQPLEPFEMVLDVKKPVEEEEQVITRRKVTETITVERQPEEEVHEISELQLETEEQPLQPVEITLDIPKPQEEEEIITTTKVTETITVERHPEEEVHEVAEVTLETEEQPLEPVEIVFEKPMEPEYEEYVVPEETKVETRRKVTEQIELTMEKVEEEIPLAKTELQLKTEAHPLEQIELVLDVPKQPELQPEFEEVIVPEEVAPVKKPIIEEKPQVEEEHLVPQKIKPVKEPITFKEKPEVEEEILAPEKVEPVREPIVFEEVPEKPVEEELLAPEKIELVREPIVFEEVPEVKEEVREEIVLKPEFEEVIMPLEAPEEEIQPAQVGVEGK